MPAVSVILPAYNAARFVARAVRSVLAQTLADWELIAVDDGSADDTWAVLGGFAAADRRVRAIRLPANRGQAVARNRGLLAATAPTVAYLDADDELAPDHLARVRDWAWRADVLLFRYAVVTPAAGGEVVREWDPAPHLPHLPARNPAVPIGVAHRRDVVDRVGGFDERVRYEEDWDFWRRLAAAGFTVLCVPFASGRYHVRPDSVARTSAPAPVPPPAAATGEPVPPQRVLFASYHCHLEPTSGAAVGTRAVLERLAARGWACEAVCGPVLDDESGGSPADAFAALGVASTATAAGGAADPATAYTGTVGGVPTTAVAPDRPSARRVPDEAEATRFVGQFDRACRDFRPDVVLTYGGLSITRWLAEVARGRGARVAFAVHNLGFERADLFRHADVVVTPSGFAAEHYRRALAVGSVVTPCPLATGAVGPPAPPGRSLLFVNPQPAKGAYWVAGLAQELAARRPDVRLVVVDARHAAGPDWGALPNVRVVGPTAAPAELYRDCRAVLVPSLAAETFGRVAAEALANGRPVLASDRGALPDTVGPGGRCLPIPPMFTPTSTDVPGPADVREWVEAVERLWDDEGEYRRLAEAGLQRAAAWEPGRLTDAWAWVLADGPGPAGRPFYRPVSID